jgi:hypothetical protein
MKKLLTAALAALCLTAPAANAQLEYKQVGTIKANDYQYRTSNLPVYTMSKYAQGVTIYRKDFLSMNANTLIKELTFFGYQDAKSGTVQYSLYIGNTTSTSIDDFIIPGENEGSAATTLFDLSKVTKFADVTLTTVEKLGSAAEPVEILTFTNDTGFDRRKPGYIHNYERWPDFVCLSIHYFHDRQQRHRRQFIRRIPRIGLYYRGVRYQYQKMDEI